MKNAKRILVYTGTRADFGKLVPLIDELIKYGFNIKILPGIMHFSSLNGYTYREISSRYPEMVLLPSKVEDYYDKQDEQILIDRLKEALNVNKYTHLLIHGDRYDAALVALISSNELIDIIHVEGGQLSGNLDEHYRHAISKLAKIHLVMFEEDRQRLIRMGEVEDAIRVIGHPTLLPYLNKKYSDKLYLEALNRYKIENMKFCILVYHYETGITSEEIENAIKLMNEIVVDSGAYPLIIGTNNDNVHLDININNLLLSVFQDRCRFFPSIRHEYYLALLAHAEFIIGNSSSGILEAPATGTFCINIGDRQKNRSTNRYIFNINNDENENVGLEYLKFDEYRTKISGFEAAIDVMKITSLKDVVKWIENYDASYIKDFT